MSNAFTFPQDAMRLYSEGPARVWAEAPTWGESGLIIDYMGRATRDVPGTIIRAGDFVVLPRAGQDYDPRRHFRAAVHRVPRGQFQAIREHIDAFEFVASSYNQECRRNLGRYVSHHSARCRGSDATSRLIVLRDRHDFTARPIVAASDDAAIFELLAQVGGRMPTEDSADA